jgi:hypothetical protein
MVPKVPVSFGTNAAASTCAVTPVAGIEAAELFSVVFTDADTLIVTATAGALVDGKALPPKGVLLKADRPFRVRVGTREWELSTTGDGDWRSTVSRLFDRIQPQPPSGLTSEKNQPKEIHHA